MNEFLNIDPKENDILTKEILAPLDDQYVEMEPRPKILSPIFEILRSDQIEFLSGLRYKTLEDAALAGSKYVDSVNQQFEQLSSIERTRLLGEVVILNGTNLISSDLGINLETAETTLSGAIVKGEHTEYTSITAGVRGQFEGISYLVGNDGKDAAARTGNSAIGDGAFYIRLYYLVQHGYTHTPFGDLPASVLGEIGTSKLTFEDDNQYQAIRDSLGQLFSNESLEIATLVNDLNRVLSSPGMSAWHLRRISKLVERLHAHDDLRVQDSEALLDLISTYISCDFPYAIDVTDAIEYPIEARGTESIWMCAQDGSLLEFDQKIKDIIFAPGYETIKDPLSEELPKEKGIVPYFVLERDKAIVHIPMNHVKSFDLGGY